MYPEVSLLMQSHEEAMKKREDTLRKDLQKFAEQEDSMTDERNYLWGNRTTMGGGEDSRMVREKEVQKITLTSSIMEEQVMRN